MQCSAKQLSLQTLDQQLCSSTTCTLAAPCPANLLCVYQPDCRPMQAGQTRSTTRSNLVKLTHGWPHQQLPPPHQVRHQTAVHNVQAAGADVPHCTNCNGTGSPMQGARAPAATAVLQQGHAHTARWATHETHYIGSALLKSHLTLNFQVQPTCQAQIAQLSCRAQNFLQGLRCQNTGLANTSSGCLKVKASQAFPQMRHCKQLVQNKACVYAGVQTCCAMRAHRSHHNMSAHRSLGQAAPGQLFGSAVCFAAVCCSSSHPCSRFATQYAQHRRASAAECSSSPCIRAHTRTAWPRTSQLNFNLQQNFRTSTSNSQLDNSGPCWQLT